MSESMIERVRAAVQAALYEYEQSTMQFKSSMVARAAIEAMRELPEEPGPRYTAGEYSRRTQAAMVDDALSEKP